ncbi:hypothetical protein [Ensifer sesbaniae]|uniref:hypothetical protein n=1 Tax=Ensifer sesbaniae TaxID=1214071 RepID=UPI0015688D47|nr:hypothetical protein [Ensifer sesbaniae]NRQ15206.1 hypothetical protein [Ensifer sesbaniae]
MGEALAGRPPYRLAAKQFQEKCEAVFRPELRHIARQFQEKCEAVFRPELHCCKAFGFPSSVILRTGPAQLRPFRTD